MEVKLSRLEKLTAKVEERGGEVLSKLYNPYKKMRFRCAERHIWQSLATNINHGKWCPKCTSRRRGEKLKNPFSDIKAFAKEKGGKCLSESTDYENLFSKLKWECAKGHTFRENFHNIRRRVHWCKKC